MRPRFLAENYAPIALIVIFFIAYGSLYPFAFHSAPPGAMRALVAGWAKPPQRGDALANILLYMPLGYFGLLTIRREVPARIRIALTILLGLSLSVTMELLQYYDSGRDTEAADVYTNVAGSALGAVVASALGDLWQKLPRQRLNDPAALLLLASWAGYNLFPFVPVIDLHKYWNAVKPLLHPALGYYGLFTHAAAWFAAALLIECLAEKRRPELLFATFIAVLLGGKILVAGGMLSAAEIAGAATALGLQWGLGNRPRAKLVLACALLGGAVIAQRLEPFHFTAQPGQFSWIPFLSFMRGSVEVDTLSFLEKAFLYGSLIWLLQKTGLRLARATWCVAAVLLATSLAEIYLPGRSAEITDAAMALFSGTVIALVRKPARDQPRLPAEGT